MSDMAYIMETQDPHELWLVDGENKFKVSRDMYWLLVSNGADLPPKHHITELLNENAKLRELLAWMYRLMDESCAIQYPYAPEPIRYDTLMGVYEKLRELGVEVTK